MTPDVSNMIAASASTETMNRRCENVRCRAMITVGDPHILCTLHRVCTEVCAACSIIARDPELCKKLEYNEKKRKMRLKRRALFKSYTYFGSKSRFKKHKMSKKNRKQSQDFQFHHPVFGNTLQNVSEPSNTKEKIVHSDSSNSIASDGYASTQAARCRVCGVLITKEDPHKVCLDHRKCDFNCEACFIIESDAELKRRLERREKDKILKRNRWNSVTGNSGESLKKSYSSKRRNKDAANVKVELDRSESPDPMTSILHHSILETSAMSQVYMSGDDLNSISSRSNTPDQLNDKGRHDKPVVDALMSLIKKPSSVPGSSKDTLEQRITKILLQAQAEAAKEKQSKPNSSKNSIKRNSRGKADHNSDDSMSNESRSRSCSPVLIDDKSRSPSPAPPTTQKEFSTMEGQLYLLNKRLSKTLPDFFEKQKSDESILSFSSSEEEASVLIVGTETLEKTWLADPPEEMTSSMDPHMWDSKVNLPTTHLTPKRAAVFRGFPCCTFDNTRWDTFLSESPKRSVQLDENLSERTCASLCKSNAYVLAEAHGRTAIKAGCVSDTYARVAEALLDKVRKGEKDPQEIMEQLSDAIRASRIMGIKAIAAQSAGVANIRYGLRNHVLDGLTANSSKSSHCLLRGKFGHSDFLGPMHNNLSKEVLSNPNLRLKRKKAASSSHSNSSQSSRVVSELNKQPIDKNRARILKRSKLRERELMQSLSGRNKYM